ncbi:Acyl-CoA dehydrogenase [Burkholderiales bacterium 8X]|nr:Acyl-CoA dehydrogenase [Burkholderiales bacterium 8X]
MTLSFPPLLPGMPLDAAERFAEDNAGKGEFEGQDPIHEMGWPLTLIPEALDGAGGTLADLGAIVEGLASHGVQLPVIESCAIAPLLLQASAESTSTWLPPVAEGTAKFAVLAPLSRSLQDVALEARQLDIGWELTGAIRGTDDSLAFTHAVMAARLQGSDEIGLFVLAADRVPQPAASYRTMEGRLGADYLFDAVSVPAGACVARGAAARSALARADDSALLLTAVDTVSSLGALVQATIAHLKERKQFGVALASFQVLRHRVADMFVRYLAARGLVLHAFQLHEANSPELPRTLRLAKVALAEHARFCAEAAIQMHGGMGVSEEVLATCLAQRLLASDFRYGDRLTHASRLLGGHRDASAFKPNPITRSA